jgi:hypothetical protein
MSSRSPLRGAPCIIDSGLPNFADEPAERSVEVLHVDWRTPASGERALAEPLARLSAHRLGAVVETCIRLVWPVQIGGLSVRSCQRTD